MVIFNWTEVVGTPHPTAKADYVAGSADDSPTGPEIVELLAAAVGQVRADAALSDRCVREGLGRAALWSWLQQMCANNMLRLFGIAPPAAS